MSEFKDLIKSDLQEDFVPRFQDLSKKMPTGFTDTIKPPKAPMTAPSGAGGGGKPPKAPVAPMAPSNPDKKPKKTGNPKPTPTTMKKQGMNEGGNEERFHIYHQGQKLTQDHETVTANDVNKKYGGVKSLEAKGFLLVPHKAAPKTQPQKAVMAGPKQSKPFLKEEHKPGQKARSMRQIMKRPKRKLVRKDEQEVIKSEVLGQFKPMFNDINEIAKKSPALALNCLSIDDLNKASTNNVIAGEHIPTDAEPAPKPKKVKGNKDEGSGGDVKKEQVKEDLKKPPANKIIKPEDDKKKDQ